MSAFLTKCPKCKEVYKWASSPRKIQRRCVRCNVVMLPHEKPKTEKPVAQPGLFDQIF